MVIREFYSYKTVHNFFFFLPELLLLVFPVLALPLLSPSPSSSSTAFGSLAFSINLAKEMKISSTLMHALADDSKNLQSPNFSAIDLPSCLLTARSSSKSHLLPTNTNGTSSESLERNNCSWMVIQSSHEEGSVIEY